MAKAAATRRLRSVPRLPEAGSFEFDASTARRCVVFDLEIQIDRHAKILSGRRGNAPRSSPLAEITCASLLTFRQDAAGCCDRFALETFHEDEYGEPDILLGVERRLVEAIDGGGCVVSFNGKAFDLPILRMRQMRWWLVDACAVGRLAAGEGEHIDLMHDISMGGSIRWPTLTDACASIGFSLLGPARVGPSDVPAQVEKCELDVVGSLILHLHLSAANRSSPIPLAQGLPAFGRFMREAARRKPHLERLATSRLLEQGSRPWCAEPA